MVHVFVDQLATATDVTRLLGEIDPLTVARVLAVAPTRGELLEAANVAIDDPEQAARTPSQARIACVRGILQVRS